MNTAPHGVPPGAPMNLSTWSIRNPIPTLLLFLMLTGLGLMSFRAMKIQNFPDIELPTISVTAQLPGAAPAQLESDVARKIENSVATLTGVKHIYSRIQDGVVNVNVEFRLEKGLQEAADDVRDAVARVRSDLPQDLRDPIVTKFDLSGMPILTYAIASNRLDEEALSWFVDNEVARAMLAVPGVGRVARVGGVTREIRVEIDPARLAALNATVSEISRQLRGCSRTPRAVAPTSAGRNSRCAPSARWPVRRSSHAWRSRSPTAVASGSTRWPRSRTRSPNGARPRCWTASRWSASRSRAARARANSTSPPACARSSSSSRPHTPACRSPSRSISSTRCTKATSVRWRCCSRARCWR